MKNVVKAFSCLVFSFVSVTALAQDEPQWWSGLYAGGSYGFARLNSGAHMNIDNGTEPCIGVGTGAGVTACPIDYYASEIKPSALEIFTGWRFMEAFGGDIGAELRISQGLPETVFTFVDLTGSAIGLYGTYQTQGPVYLKGLLGVAQTSFDMDGGSDISVSESAIGASVGFAVGQKIFGGAIEIMYMIYPHVRLDQDQRQTKFTYNPDGGSCPSSTAINCNDATITLSDKVKYGTLSVGYVYTF